MHPYSTDSEERAQIPLYIAGLGILLAWLLFQLVTHCLASTRLPFWVEIPGTGAMYAALYTLFQHHCWKWKVFHRFCIVRIPDLEGEWKGSVSSSFDKNAATHHVTVTIRQNWTHIFITLSSSVSDSKSLVAALETRSGVVLSYQYLNMPKPHAGETLHAHRGTAVLTLSGDGTQLSGEYYSSRDRQNYGALELKKV
jgi:SMODS-associating 2TM, beta-strand rich effector domain